MLCLKDRMGKTVKGHKSLKISVLDWCLALEFTVDFDLTALFAEEKFVIFCRPSQIRLKKRQSGSSTN